MHFIDRRANPQGKSLPNRQRFLERAKAQIREAVAASIAKRKVADIAADGKVKVRPMGTQEPFLHHGQGGNRDHVLPGNRDYQAGDTLPKPKGGSSGGGGGEGGNGDDGEDDFEFTLTREEFLDLFFEELALPDLVKKTLTDSVADRPQRAGFSSSGSPSALNVRRTMRNSIGRRVGMGRPKPADIDALRLKVEEAIESGDAEAIGDARAMLDQALKLVSKIPFFDPIDLRYNRFDRLPKPNVRAAMFCLMDVSGSMDEHRKDLAKRFFMLLHLFLERKYEKVDVVFVRHTTVAQEVDEETFFRSRESGGTMVSSALEEAIRIIGKRYPSDQWNIYVAQASDGDNFSADNQAAEAALERLLPTVQYFAYVETGDAGASEISDDGTDLWQLYGSLSSKWRNFAMRRVGEPAQIWGVLADLFPKERNRAAI
jgi:uncharacterized sporulation protein YeaH/YhbH (DUF444 family)